MEFRAPSVATEQTMRAASYLTENLEDPSAGRMVLNGLINELGSVVETFPDWHPILTIPAKGSTEEIYGLNGLDAYKTIDHTVLFVRGFVTCPYTEEKADRLIEAVEKLDELRAYKLNQPLYADNAYPVVVEAYSVELEADGTIRSRDALIWFSQHLLNNVWSSQVAETWWNIRSLILGSPHGSRSSLFVNQHSGAHMRKILEAFNNSGMFGPIKESSLEMLSKKKRDTICETLIRAAVNSWDGESEKFDFELRGETCRANIRDTWGDGHELSVQVVIGDHDLYVSGFFYQAKKQATYTEPRGKRAFAEKFL